MNKPTSNQRSLAGEYYVASLLYRIGLDVGLTLGNTKKYDLFAVSADDLTWSIQVKTTYSGHDWLVKGDFIVSKNAVIVFVRLGKKIESKPELYAIRSNKVNALINRKYTNHSPRISRASIRALAKDHDLSIFVE
jgi:hypothetical protein